MSDIGAEFIAVYDAHADALFRFALVGVSDRETAKDLTAETFKKVWEYIAKGNQVKNLRALCYQTLRNLIVDHYRKHRSLSIEQLSEEGYEPVGGNVRTEIEEHEESGKVREAMGKLPPTFREVISLRYVEGHSPKEIAELLGISSSLVGVRLFRGMNLLKQHITIHE